MNQIQILKTLLSEVMLIEYHLLYAYFWVSHHHICWRELNNYEKESVL